MSFAGLDATVTQSGEFEAAHNVMSKRGSPYLRKAIFQAALHKFNPENDEACMGLTPVHIRNELDFFRCMLVRVVVWSSEEVTQGLNGVVIRAFPAVDNCLLVLYLIAAFETPYLSAYLISDRRNLISCVIVAMWRYLLSG